MHVTMHSFCWFIAIAFYMALLQVFHAIVDLPCTAAVLQLHNLSKTGLIDAKYAMHCDSYWQECLFLCNSPALDSTDSNVYGQCLNALDEVRFGIIFEYFMRVESGKGDTVDL